MTLKVPSIPEDSPEPLERAARGPRPCHPEGVLSILPWDLKPNPADQEAQALLS